MTDNEGDFTPSPVADRLISTADVLDIVQNRPNDTFIIDVRAANEFNGDAPFGSGTPLFLQRGAVVVQSWCSLPFDIVVQSKCSRGAAPLILRVYSSYADEFVCHAGISTARSLISFVFGCGKVSSGAPEMNYSVVFWSSICVLDLSLIHI